MATSSYTSNLTYVENELADVAMVESPLWDRLEKAVPKDVVKIGGKFYAMGTAKVVNGWGGRQVSEGGYRPTAYAVTADETKWEMYKTWISKEFTREEIETGDLIGYTKDGNLDIKSLNLRSMLQDFAWHMDIGLRGQHTGRITNADGDGSSATALKVNDARDFEVGMHIDSFVHGDTTAYIDDGTISAVNYDTNTLTIGAETWADDEEIVVESSHNLWAYGIADILSHPTVDISVNGYTIADYLTTYGNISRSTYPKYKATVYQPAGADAMAAFKPGDFYATVAKAYTARRAMPNFTAAICDPETAASIVDAFPVNTRSMDDTRIKVGEEGLTRLYSPMLKNGYVDLLVMAHFWRYTMALINESDLKLRWTAPPGFVKDENGKTMRYLGHDAGATAPDSYVTSYMVRYGLMANPQEHAALVGIAPGESFGVAA